MTRNEYGQFVSRFTEFMQSEGLSNLSRKSGLYGSDEDESYHEGYFSWTPCECCQRPEGNTLFEADGFIRDPQATGAPFGSIGEYRVCGDCLYFAEYGQLDDMTMLDLTCEACERKEDSCSCGESDAE